MVIRMRKRTPTNAKLKTLYVMKYYMENTNPNKTASAKEVIEYLSSVGIKAERKAIYNDIEVLNKFGIKILKGHNGFYYQAG